jgi:hypothetical protein
MQCERCKQQISGTSITVTIDCNSDDGINFLEPDDNRIDFCCWECAAMWFNARASEILMPDLDTEYWQEQIRS